MPASDSSRDRLSRRFAARRSRSIHPAKRKVDLGFAAGDQIRDRQAGAGAMRPSQRAVAGVEPQVR